MGQTTSPQTGTALNRVSRNLGMKFSGEIVVRVCFFLLFVYAARVLGRDDFGRFSWAVSLAWLALSPMELGLNPIVVKEVATNPAALGRVTGASLFAQGVLVCALICLFYLGLFWAGAPKADRSLLGATSIVHAAWGLCLAGLAGLAGAERMGLEAMVKAAARLTSLLAAGGLLLLGHGYWGLLLGLGASNLLGLLLALFCLARLGGLRLWPSRGLLARLVRQSLPLALSGIFMMAYTRLDQVMLQMLGRPFGEIGWYAGAVRVVEGLGNLPLLLAGALLPVFASLAGEQRDRLLRQSLRLALLLGLPAATGLAMLGREICLLLFGPAYGASGPALALLAPAAGLLFPNAILLAFLAASGRQKLSALAAGGCLLFNFLLNLWLIPSRGYLGAALATSLGELFMAGFCLSALAGPAAPWSLARRAAPILAACLAMAGVLYWGRGFPLWARAGLGGLAYLALLPALGGVGAADLRQLWAGLARPRATTSRADSDKLDSGF